MLKKFTTIFLSVILALVIFTIPNKVLAMKINDFDIPADIDLTQDTLIFGSYTSNNIQKYYMAVYRNELRYGMVSGNSYYIGNGFQNFEHWFYNLETESWELYSNSYGRLDLNTIYYTNANIYAYGYPNNPNYLRFAAQDPIIETEIKFTSAFACDINNIEMEYTTIDFSDFADDKYQYQYAITYIRSTAVDLIWQDIDQLYDNKYNLSLYYNGMVVYARVLENGEEVATAEYVINQELLPRFGIQATTNIDYPQHLDNNPEYDIDYIADIITLDISSGFNENYTYQYSWDALTWHLLPIENNKMIYTINNYLQRFIVLEILDENGNVIYYDHGIRSEQYIGEYDQNRGTVKYSNTIACDENNNDIIYIKIDFRNITTFTHQYGFRVVINGTTYYNLPVYEEALNVNNYISNYDVKVYIDRQIIYSEIYHVGHLTETGQPIQGEFENTNFNDTYSQIQNDYMQEVNGYDSLDLSSSTELVINFLTNISAFVAGFFDLIFYFYNKLNSWIKAFILSLFVIYIICRIIKVARKK